MKLNLSYTLKTTFLSLLCVAVAGCNPEDRTDVERPEEAYGTVELIFSTSSGLYMRSTLSGSDNLQHVREVQLYVFNGTADDAICVASEDVEWKEKATDAGLGTKEQRYIVKYNGFIDNTTYTFIAVGLYDLSGDTYGLPGAIAVGSTTLDQAKAMLANGKGRGDIAQSELFGGGGALTIDDFDEGVIHPVEIDLYRRVAGVMGWFKSVPDTIDGRAVARLRIELYKAQNQSIYLTEHTLASDPSLFADYIMSPIGNVEREENQILVDIELTPEDFVSEAVVSKGAYVLPMIAPFADEASMTAAGYDDSNIYVKDYTLRIVLLDAEGRELRVKRVKDADAETGGGTGIIVDAYRFEIRANYFYSIGSASEPVDLEETDDPTPSEAIVVWGPWQADVDIEI
jgi:hypothetical protein